MRVVYEDNHLLVVDKPPGISTQSDTRSELSLHEEARRYIKERYAKPGNVFLGLVHRIDRPVAGLVLFARTSKAARRLTDQFKARQIDKTYRALVEGHLKPRRGRLEGWILREGSRSRVSTEPRSGAREATLGYRVLSMTRRSSDVVIDLETGRKHQIRAQLARAGHPVLGDRKYGARQMLEAGRIALIAWRLAFDHPTKNERVSLEATLPGDWHNRS